MLKQSKSPDGYKHLLVYKKADELLAETLNFTATFPHEKTVNDLEDQMNRSARSVKANIVEGWKRNATHEYYTFLGYSVASNAELLEDYLNICNGHYEARGIKGFGERGEKGNQIKDSPLPPSTPLPHFDIHKLRFYPLDPLLPIAVKLFLKTKELNYLLETLQKSLVNRMQEKKTLGEADRFRLVERERKEKEDESDRDFLEYLEKGGLVFTGRGIMSRQEARDQHLEPIKGRL